jgi:hypothetical protein
MSSDVLIGLLLGIFLFSSVVVVWQIVLTLMEVRETVRTVKDITASVHKEVSPAIADINEIIHKSNLAMEEAGENYKHLRTNGRTFAKALKRAQGQARHYLAVGQAGVTKAVAVYRGEEQ